RRWRPAMVNRPTTATPDASRTGREPRAAARRNQARVLEGGTEVFAPGAINRGLDEALAGAGYDLEDAAARAGYDLPGRLRDLLARAQQAGAVRPDVDYADVKALLAGCVARDRSNSDPAALDRIIAVVHQGLRTSPAEQAGRTSDNA